jgi:signal transduction histidine kinase
MKMPLQGENRLYKRLFESLPQAVILLDGQLRVLLGNQAACRLLQVAQDRLRGMSLSSLIPREDLPKLILEFGEQPVKVIELHPPPDQDSHPSRILKITVVRVSSAVLASGAPAAGSGPEEEFRLLVMEDFSERVMLEDQLVQVEKLAGMGQLAAGIAHELGNPLGSMRSNLQYIRAGLAADGHPGLVEPLDATLDNLDRMHILLRSLSEFTGQRHPHYESADLDALIRRSLAFIAKGAEKHGIELVVFLADSLPLCHLDVRAISQVLLNIFKNAMEAMPEGGRLTIRTRLDASQGQGSEAAVIEIQDTGTGIEEGELRKVFRPLYSTKPRGTGLGLSFSRQVVEEHGGEIHLASQWRKGTTVTLVLPVHQEGLAIAAF